VNNALIIISKVECLRIGWMLRRIFGPKGDEIMEIGENCIMRSSITCTPLQV
jgi:hypothetical protein